MGRLAKRGAIFRRLSMDGVFEREITFGKHFNDMTCFCRKKLFCWLQFYQISDPSRLQMHLKLKYTKKNFKVKNSCLIKGFANLPIQIFIKLFYKTFKTFVQLRSRICSESSETTWEHSGESWRLDSYSHMWCWWSTDTKNYLVSTFYLTWMGDQAKLVCGTSWIIFNYQLLLRSRFKDNEKVPIRAEKYVTKYSNGIAELSIRNIIEKDAGVYKICATNEIGSIENEATVVVEVQLY